MCKKNGEKYSHYCGSVKKLVPFLWIFFFFKVNLKPMDLKFVVIYDLFIKIHVRGAAAEDILKFTCMGMYLFVCVTSPGHTNNDTDLKFGTHTPIDLF